MPIPYRCPLRQRTAPPVRRSARCAKRREGRAARPAVGERPLQDGHVALAHLVEGDHVGLLGMDHRSGPVDGPAREAAGETAVAEVQLQNARRVAPGYRAWSRPSREHPRPGSRRPSPTAAPRDPTAAPSRPLPDPAHRGPAGGAGRLRACWVLRRGTAGGLAPTEGRCPTVAFRWPANSPPASSSPGCVAWWRPSIPGATSAATTRRCATARCAPGWMRTAPPCSAPAACPPHRRRPPSNGSTSWPTPPAAPDIRPPSTRSASTSSPGCSTAPFTTLTATRSSSICSPTVLATTTHHRPTPATTTCHRAAPATTRPPTPAWWARPTPPALATTNASASRCGWHCLTLLGHDEHPGEIPGLGPVPASTPAPSSPATPRRVALRHHRRHRSAAVRRRHPAASRGAPPPGHPAGSSSCTYLRRFSPPSRTAAKIGACGGALGGPTGRHRPPVPRTRPARPRRPPRRPATPCRAAPPHPDPRPHMRRHRLPPPPRPLRPGPHRRPPVRRAHRRRRPGAAVPPRPHPQRASRLDPPTTDPGTFLWTSPLGGRYPVRPEPVLPPLPDPCPGPTTISMISRPHQHRNRSPCGRPTHLRRRRTATPNPPTSTRRHRSEHRARRRRIPAGCSSRRTDPRHHDRSAPLKTPDEQSRRTSSIGPDTG